MDSLTLKLKPNYELRAENIPERVKEAFSHLKNSFFMKHQIDTYNANKEFDLVFNTYPTGTGKTKASLFHMIDKPEDNVLFIAPTNELISQHCGDIEKFVNDTKLNHEVIELNSSILNKILENTDVIRRGEVLYRLLTNPFTYKSELNIKSKDVNKPYVIVTNPDIFYYAITFNYSEHDKRNVFYAMFTCFNYTVIDEFHYYAPKQLCTFLFFFSLCNTFGYFKDGRKKITILTATPSLKVTEYFERLEKEGLKYTILAPEKVEEISSYSDRTLSPVNLKFVTSEHKFSHNIQENINFLLEKMEHGYDGAIISNSLININDCKNLLKSSNIQDIGLITGVTDKKERAESKDKNLILATPTVDIGYNFDKKKERQNIDYLIFDFQYEDQFWQRLGRAGRVLGKNIRNIPSDVITFISEDELTKLKKSFSDGQEIFRQDLAKETSKIFKCREDFFNYINSWGLSEMSRPIEELRKIFDKETIVTENLFNSISKIFTNSERSYYKSVKKVSRRYEALKEGLEDITKCKTELVNEFTDFFNKHDHDLINRENLENFISEEYFLLRGLYNFRESFSGISCVVYDPLGLMGFSENKVLNYDLFHLLRFYDLKFYNRNDFIKRTSKLDFIDKEEVYCEIVSRLDENLSIYYTLKTDFDKDTFEARYLNHIISKNNIEFNLYKPSKTGKSNKAMPLKILDAQKFLRKQYIPCIIISRDLRSLCHKNNINFQSLVVTFSNDFKEEEKYSIILGTKSYYINDKISKISDYIEQKTKFYVC